MIAPDTRILPLALTFRSSRFTRVAGTENAMTSIKPAVRSPGECVEDLMGVRGVIPAIEKKLGIASRLRGVPVLHRDEHQVGGRANPYAAKTNLQATDEVYVFHENCA